MGNAKRTGHRTRDCLNVALVMALAGTAISPPAAAKEARRLAVLEFSGSDLKVDVLEAMSDSVRSGALAVQGRTYDVMTRESITMILKEMAGSGKCGEGECAVETARNVGAHLVITGDVLLVEETYVVTLKLRETQKGTLLSTQRVEGKGQLEVLNRLPGAARALVSEGLGLHDSGEEGSELSFSEMSLRVAVPEVSVSSTNDSLGEINIAAEQRLEAAMDQQENKKARPADKAMAWCALAGITEKNPYLDKASAACKAWQAYAEEQDKMFERMKLDYGTLDEYLRLKRKTLRQKEAVVNAFLVAYRRSEEASYLRVVAMAGKELAAGRDATLCPIERIEECGAQLVREAAAEQRRRDEAAAAEQRRRDEAAAAEKARRDDEARQAAMARAERQRKLDEETAIRTHRRRVGIGLIVSGLVMGGLSGTFLALGSHQNGVIQEGGLASGSDLQTAISNGHLYNGLSIAGGVLMGVGLVIGLPVALANLPKRKVGVDVSLSPTGMGAALKAAF